MKTIKLYYPWPNCPSISISGGVCALNCRHCNKKYIEHMTSAITPDKLLITAKKFEKNCAVGLLISGGCDKQGRLLNLQKLLPTIKKIKEETNLIIKLHTGFVDNELSKKIADANIDIASNEFVGSQKTIKKLFNLDFTPKDYVATFLNLERSGIPFIAPHVCVGLHYGKLKGEFNALDIIKSHINPSTLAIIVFRPTIGTELENVSAPIPEDVSKVVKYAKKLFPKKPILLGSLRPRSSKRNDPNKELRYNIEKFALDSGITRMELPSDEIIETIKKRGFRIKRINAYGVLPEEYEDRVSWEWVK